MKVKEICFLVAFFATQIQSLEYKRGLTQHFITWLNDTGYEPYGFNRTQYFGGSFGGRENDSSPITKRPVVFIHGNCDMIIGDTDMNNGFHHTIEYFLQRGYSKAELYGSMWGFADYPHNHSFNAETILYIRKFINAVLEYTNVTQIDVISHSMGVIYARRVLQGGWAKTYSKHSVGTDDDMFFIGEPLESKVSTFLAIAGSNWGNPLCLNPNYTNIVTCNQNNGYWPGDQDSQPYPLNLSKLILDLNNNTVREGVNTYAIYSQADQLVPYKVYSRFTSEFPGMNASFGFIDYSHLEIRDKTTFLQYNLITYQQPEEPPLFLIN